MYIPPQPPRVSGPGSDRSDPARPEAGQGGECDPGAASHWSPPPDAGLSLADAARGNRPSRLLTRGPARLAFLFSVTFLDTGFRLLVSLEPIGGAFH